MRSLAVPRKIRSKIRSKEGIAVDLSCGYSAINAL